MVHGHNGYVDVALAMGLPALAIALMAFAVEPMRDYLRTPPIRENVLLVYPKTLFDLVGFALVAVVLGSQWLRAKR